MLNIEELKKCGDSVNIYVSGRVRDNINRVYKCVNGILKKENYKGKFHYAYATKANYLPYVIDEAIEASNYIEFSSENDIAIVNKINKKFGNNVTILCNGIKTQLYLDRIIYLKKKGFNIIPIVDNVDEVKKLLKYNIKLDIGIRINIENELYGSNKTRFGIELKEIDKIIELTGGLLNPIMIHSHNSCIHNQRDYIEYINYLSHVYIGLKKKIDTLKYLNFGGGLPVFDLENIKGKLDKSIHTFKVECFKNKIEEPSLVVEFGTYTVNNAFMYAYRVIAEKEFKNNTYYILNTCLMNFIPEAWALDKKFDIKVLKKARNKRKAYLCGLTCDYEDAYGPVMLPKNTDDLYVVFNDVGAYQSSLSGYGGIHHCLISESSKAILKDGKLSLIEKKQTSEQILEVLKY